MFSTLKEAMNKRLMESSDSVDTVHALTEESLEDDYMDDEGFDDNDPELNKIIAKIPEYDGGEDLTDADLELADDVVDPTINELVESTLFL